MSRKELQEVSSRVYPDLERVPGKQNWVDKTGGLPSYIERIAKHLHYEKGRTIGAAIATAVETTRRWCSTGKNWNGGDLKPATRAKACKAVASWEAKKAKSKAKTAAKKLKESAEMMEARELIEAKGALPCDDTVAKELASLVKKRLMVAEGMLPALTEPKTVGKAGLVRSAVELLEAELSDEVKLGMIGGPAADPRDMKAVADLMAEEVEELRALAESLGDAPPWEKPNPKAKKGKKGKGKKLSPEAKAKAKAKAKKAGRKYPNLVDNMNAAKEMAEMKRGDTGDGVKRFQTQIEVMECYIGDAGADGKFGYHTERGVKAIQRRHGLKADGIVGPKTTAALDAKVPDSLLEAKGLHPYSKKGNNVVDGATKPAAFTKKDREWGLSDRAKKADAADPEFERKHPRNRIGRWIEKGATGREVRRIQNKVGMDKPSGEFDGATVKAVREYQQENNLQVDGIVGQQTAASMMGKEAPVGELTDAQRKWLSSDSTGKKEMKEAAFVPGWEVAGSRFDRTNLTEAVDKGKVARWLDGVAATAMKGDAAGLAKMFGEDSWPSEWDADIDEMLYEGDDDKLEAMRKVIKAVRNSGDTKRDEAYFRSVLSDDEEDEGDEGMEDDDKKEMEEADVAGSGEAEAATDGNTVEAPEGPPNLRESRGGDMRCETCEYFEGGKCLSHGGHPVKGTQVCDEWESEMSDVMEATSVARRGLRAIRSIDLPSIDLPDRKRAPRPIYRLPDGTFAPKGMGAILRPGDEVTISGKRGKVSADGKSIEVPGETAKRVAPEARATEMASPGDRTKAENDDLRQGITGLISDVESIYGPRETLSPATQQLFAVLESFGWGSPDPARDVVGAFADVMGEWGSGDEDFDYAVDVVKKFGLIEERWDELLDGMMWSPGDKDYTPEQIAYGKRRAALAWMAQNEHLFGPELLGVTASEKDAREWLDANPDEAEAVLSGEMASPGETIVKAGGGQGTRVPSSQRPGEMPDPKVGDGITLSMGSGIVRPGTVTEVGSRGGRESVTVRMDSAEPITLTPEGKIPQDRPVDYRVTPDPNGEIVRLTKRGEGEWRQTGGGSFRVHSIGERKYYTDFFASPGDAPSRSAQREANAYFILNDVQDALYDVTTAENKAEQIEGVIEYYNAVKENPGEAAQAFDQIGLLLRDVRDAGVWNEGWDKVSDALSGRDWMESPADLTRPLVAPERRRLLDRMIQVRDRLYPPSVRTDASAVEIVTDAANRDRLREEYLRLRDLLSRDAALRDTVLMASPSSESVEKATEEIEKLSFNELLEYFPLDMAATEEMMRTRLIALKAAENRRDGEMASPDEADYSAAKAMVDKLSFSQLIEFFPEDWASTEETMRRRLVALRANEIEIVEQERGLPGAEAATIERIADARPEMASPVAPDFDGALAGLTGARERMERSQAYSDSIANGIEDLWDAVNSLSSDMDAMGDPMTPREIALHLRTLRRHRGDVAPLLSPAELTAFDSVINAVDDSLVQTIATNNALLAAAPEGELPKWRKLLAKWAPDFPGWVIAGVLSGAVLEFASPGDDSGVDVPEGLIKPDVPLVGEDGNAFAIMGRTIKALRRAGNPQEVIDSYQKQATSGDYDNLLRVTMAFINEGGMMDSPADAPEAEALRGMNIASLSDLIARDWGDKVNYAAVPYLDAMRYLDDLDSRYGMEQGWMIVPYFLANAGTWRGPVARAVKAELKRRLDERRSRRSEMASPGGWANDATWAMAQALDNDEGSYRFVQEILRRNPNSASAAAAELRDAFGDGGPFDTPAEGVDWDDLAATWLADGEMASPSGAGISSDPEWNSVPRLRARLLQTGGRNKAQRITDRIAALEAAESSGSRLLSLKEGDRFFIPSQGLTGVVTKSPDENGFGGRADVAFDGGERLEVAIGPLTEQGAISGDTMVVPDGGEMASPTFGDSVPDYAQETIDEVRDLLVKKDGFSMDLRGEYEMVANLVPGFEEMGVPGGDPNFPSQTKYSPDEMLRILAYLSNDLGDPDGTGENGYALASDILYILSDGETGPWGGPWEGPEVDNALMMLAWMTPGAGQDDEMASPGGAVVLTGDRSDPKTGFDPMETVTHQRTLPPGTYVIGDPAYFRPSTYQSGNAWLPSLFETRRLEVERGEGMAWVATANGDGAFTDEQGRVYGVDTGTLAIIGDPTIPPFPGKVWDMYAENERGGSGVWIDEPEEGELWMENRPEGPVPYEKPEPWNPKLSEGMEEVTFAGPVSVSYEAGDVVFSDGETTVRISTGDPEMASPGDSPGVFRKPRVADAAGWELDPENEFYLPVRVERPTGLAAGSDLAPGALRDWYKVTPPGGRTRYFFGESAWSDASRYAGDQHSKLMREQDPWMASPDGPQVERTDIVKAASQLEVGDMVRLADGEYVEVIDLKPMGYNGNPLGGVAIFTEDDDLPIRASMNQRVTVQDDSFEMASPEATGPIRMIDPLSALITGAERLPEGASVTIGNKWDGERGWNYTGGKAYYKVGPNSWESADGDALNSEQIEAGLLDFLREMDRNPTAWQRRISGLPSQGMSAEERLAQTEFDEDASVLPLATMDSDILSRLLSGPVGRSEFGAEIQAELDRRAALRDVSDPDQMSRAELLRYLGISQVRASRLSLADLRQRVREAQGRVNRGLVPLD